MTIPAVHSFFLTFSAGSARVVFGVDVGSVGGTDQDQWPAMRGGV